MKLQHVSLHYFQQRKKKVIFRRLNFDLPDQGLITITGDSGIGKSSLLKVLAKILKPTHGKVIYPSKAKGLLPLYLSDQLSLVPHWKVKEYLQTPAQREQARRLGFDNGEFNKSFQQLSIGQQVRLKVILFLNQLASIYLIDEPTHALDESNRRKIIEFLKEQSQEKCLIIATHDQMLIASCDVEIQMSSSFQTIIKKHQTLPLEIVEVKKSISVFHDPWKHWFKKLTRLYRVGPIGVLMSFALVVIQVAIYLTLLLTFQFQEQMNQYNRLVTHDPWIQVVENQTISIHDSPFQLVKYIDPRQESFSVLFQNSTTAQWLIDISDWFPKFIKIDGVEVLVRFVDLPFDNQHISTAWIYPKKPIPYQLQISTIHLPFFDQPLHFSGPIRMFHMRSPISWFESHQLLLSYWQWLSILSNQKTIFEEQLTSYLNIYLELLPPSTALIYEPNAVIRLQLQSMASQTWQFRNPSEIAYPLISPLMEPILNSLPFFIMILLIIWSVLWWSKFHWIYQQHYRDWQWMLMFHQKMKTIWIQLTKRVTFQSSMLEAASLFIATLFILIQPWLPIPNVNIFIFIQIGTWISLQCLRNFIRNWFQNA